MTLLSSVTHGFLEEHDGAPGLYRDESGTYVIRSVQDSPLVPVDGGSATPQILDLSLSTDPDTFTVDWEHDFGRVTPVFVWAKVSALDGDGETWGDAPGEIAVAHSLGGPVFEGRRDDAVFLPGWTTLGLSAFGVLSSNANDAFDTTGQYVAYDLLIPQCLRLAPGAWAIVSDGGNGGLYAGPNHPTATFQLYVEYL